MNDFSSKPKTYAPIGKKLVLLLISIFVASPIVSLVFSLFRYSIGQVSPAAFTRMAGVTILVGVIASFVCLPGAVAAWRANISQLAWVSACFSFGICLFVFGIGGINTSNYGVKGIMGDTLSWAPVPIISVILTAICLRHFCNWWQE